MRSTFSLSKKSSFQCSNISKTGISKFSYKGTGGDSSLAIAYSISVGSVYGLSSSSDTWISNLNIGALLQVRIESFYFSYSIYIYLLYNNTSFPYMILNMIYILIIKMLSLYSH